MSISLKYTFKIHLFLNKIKRIDIKKGQLMENKKISTFFLFVIYVTNR